MRSKSFQFGLVAILLFATVVACAIALWLFKEPGLPESGVAFKATVKPQLARFLTGPGGWTGAPFASPVFASTQNTRDSRGVTRVNDLQVGMGEEELQMIYAKLPELSTIPGGMVILVEAKIHLELAGGTVSTAPPSSRQYYKVVIDKLINARWYTAE